MAQYSVPCCGVRHINRPYDQPGLVMAHRACFGSTRMLARKSHLCKKTGTVLKAKVAIVPGMQRISGVDDLLKLSASLYWRARPLFLVRRSDVPKPGETQSTTHEWQKTCPPATESGLANRYLGRLLVFRCSWPLTPRTYLLKNCYGRATRRMLPADRREPYLRSRLASEERERPEEKENG